MITALHLSPHPDDEVLGAGATLLGLRAHGHRVINLACSLGRPEQEARRRAEVEEACERADFELVVHDPPLALASGDDAYGARRALAATVEALVEDERVDLVISPDRDDAHHAHKTVAAVARTAGVRWWTWGLWRDLARPTIFSGFGEERLALLQHVLAAHSGELERNDYAELLRARAIAARVLGAERVFGFGAQRRPERYAELLADGGPPRVLDLADPLDG
ncbi:MAG: PIG-L deacetylase family protein [Solirubrobacteraceae bacterium]